MWAGRRGAGTSGPVAEVLLSKVFRAESDLQPEGSHVHFVCFCSFKCPPCVLTAPRGVRFSKVPVENLGSLGKL